MISSFPLQIDEEEVSKLKAELLKKRAAGGETGGGVVRRQQSFGASLSLPHPRDSVDKSR